MATIKAYLYIDVLSSSRNLPRTKTTIAIDLTGGETAGNNLGLRFTVEGTEQNVAAMLALIEQSPYAITIDSVEIHRAEQSSLVNLMLALHVSTQ